jgi:hypothetical protein
MVTYKGLESTLRALLDKLCTLAGEQVGQADCTWQSVAMNASKDAHVLSLQLMGAAKGQHESFMCFPSPSECTLGSEDYIEVSE